MAGSPLPCREGQGWGSKVGVRPQSLLHTIPAERSRSRQRSATTPTRPPDQVRGSPSPQGGGRTRSRPQQPAAARPDPRRGRRGASHTSKIDLPRLLAALARRPRRDRALGAPEAHHRRAAHRRLGPARQDGGRRASAASSRTRSSRSGTGSSRPTKTCSPGSRAGAGAANHATRPRSARRCCRTRSRTSDLRQARRLPTSWPSGNGTASACRPSCGRAGDGRLVAPHLFAHRRGRVAAPSRTSSRRSLRGRHRRRTADRARGPRAELQRAAAAPQPEDRDAKARSPSIPAHLRAYDILGRGRGGPARPCPSPSAARRLEAPRGARSTIRASTSRRWCPSRPGTSWPRRGPIPASVGAGRGCGGHRGLHAQARRQPLRARPPQGAVVQVEARPLPRRRRA